MEPGASETQRIVGFGTPRLNSALIVLLKGGCSMKRYPMVKEKRISRSESATKHDATRNACKLCTPLGASLVFRGIRNAVPFLHGSQGCSTYIRRYMISHFKEPIDIACSNFSEHTVIFGGSENLKIGLDNIRKQYHPDLIGIATTCLSETIGDDVTMFLDEYRKSRKDEELPPLVPVSTPSYRGTHIDGFHGAVRSLAQTLVTSNGSKRSHINIFPGMVSPADLRHIKEIFEDFDVPYIMTPDYSDTLDGELWQEYHRIPPGGTPVDEMKRMGSSSASIEFGRVLAREQSAGKFLEQSYSVPCRSLGLPIGVKETDRFLNALSSVAGKDIPEKYRKERGRLLDAYADGHKYVMEARAALYGEEDLVVGMASFLHEIGVTPVLCASGGKSGHLKEALQEVLPDVDENEMTVMSGADFSDLEEAAHEIQPDIFIGNSKGYSITRKLKLPLVRIGFPIHDRIGGPRMLHVGYRGAQNIFDRIANAIIEYRQESTGIGYSYM